MNGWGRKGRERLILRWKDRKIVGGLKRSLVESLRGSFSEVLGSKNVLPQEISCYRKSVKDSTGLTRGLEILRFIFQN
jgi:hypothetical protein